MKKTFYNKYVQRSIMFIILLFSIIVINAKNRYLAKYNTTITEKINGQIHSESCNYSNEFSVKLLDGKLRVIVCHEEITPDMEKVLKSLKTTANLHMMNSILGGISSINSAVGGASPRSDIIESKISANKAVLTEQEIEELKDLSVALILENTSNEELLVNDIENGLIWFIQPNSDVVIEIPKPKRKMKLRASTVQISQQPISLIDITALSEVKCYDVLCEDNAYLYCSPQKTGKRDDMYEIQLKPKYYRIDKNTVEETEITEKEYKEARKMIKEGRKD